MLATARALYLVLYGRSHSSSVLYLCLSVCSCLNLFMNVCNLLLLASIHPFNFLVAVHAKRAQFLCCA